MNHKRANSFFSKLLLKFGARAIMLGSTAYYATDAAFRDYRVRKHEEAHYTQRKRDGLWTFYTKYLWYQVRYGIVYTEGIKVSSAIYYKGLE